MNKASFSEDVAFSEKRVMTKVILETAFSKEIRIVLKKGLSMKEHKAPFPIAVHVLEGMIDFGVEGNAQSLSKGDIITLDANVPHDLTALEDSVVRLSLFKEDTAERVEKVLSRDA